MTSIVVPLWGVIVAAVCVALLIVLALVSLAKLAALARAEAALGDLRVRIEGVAGANERLERELRAEITQSRGDMQHQGQALRQEVTLSIGQFGQTLQSQIAGVAQLQGSRMEAFAAQLSTLTQSTEQRLEAVRSIVEQRLELLRTDSASKLEQMRATVDEKLHATLEQRLGASFRLVSERLELVQRGLGEMQTLAAGVGDLKRVLTNVKTRGTWGEVQLESLLEHILVRSQYEKNVSTVPGSSERVEFAIRLPGRGEGADGSGGEAPVWLPLDAKFPLEDYLRLVEAQERADAAAVESEARQLETRIRQEAAKIREKYIGPPHTTDFGILYLPVEGLYAEVLRRPGLSEQLQREHHVVLAGPTTLAAMLNSLQMGFRTLAIEKRSSEVWTLLGAVKTEFGKFADILAKTKDKLEQATNQLAQAETRTRVIERRLRGVEALPEGKASPLLPAEISVAGSSPTAADIGPD